MLAETSGTAAAFGAVLLTCAVAGRWMDSLDHRLLSSIRPRTLLTESGKRRPLTTAAVDVSIFGGDTFRVICIAGCMMLLGGSGRWRDAWIIVATIAAARLFLFLVKRIVRRPRPDASGHGVEIYTKSFPSGHTFMTMVSFLTIALITTADAGSTLRNCAVLFSISVATLVGYARLYLGVHWPSDIAVGWLAGVAWAIATAMLTGAL